MIKLYVPKTATFHDVREAVLLRVEHDVHMRDSWIDRTIACKGRLPPLLVAAKQFGFEILETP